MIVYSGDAVRWRKALAEGPVGENLRSIHLATYSGVTVNGCSAHHISQGSRQYANTSSGVTGSEARQNPPSTLACQVPGTSALKHARPIACIISTRSRLKRLMQPKSRKLTLPSSWKR